MWLNIVKQIQTDIYCKIRSIHTPKKSKDYRANKRREAKRYNVNEDPKLISNIFNQYFINVGKNLAESSNFDFKKYLPQSHESLSFHNFFCLKIETEDVINLVNKKW